MIKIINGIRYNTDSAIKIGTTTKGAKNDAYYIAETLFRAPRSGRFFIAGEGGVFTRYSRQGSSGSWCGGSKVIPLSIDNAREWCEQNLFDDDWTQYFADQIQDA